MIPAILANIEEKKELSEQEIDALYLYLDMYLDTMTDDEKVFWFEIMKRFDKDFYDNTSDGSNDLRSVQSS